MERDAARSDATFYLSMAIISTVLVFLGFAPSFYLRGVIPAPVPPLTALTLTHGLVFTTWMLLFVTQAALVRFGRLAAHRQLGMMLAILFGAMMTLGVSTAITAGRLGHAPPFAPAPLKFMALPLFGLAQSLFLVALALWNRRRSDWHKRLMLAAVFTFTPPGTGRLFIPLGHAADPFWASVYVAELLLLVAVAYDVWRHKRLHPAYVVAIVADIATHAAIAWGFSSPAWLPIAHWLTKN